MSVAALPLHLQHADWRPRFNPWLIAISVTLATFMEVLDISIANVALPHIAGNLSATTDEATWVLTSYLVANAIVLPLSGWLSTLFGRKRFYMTCVALFTISSMLCGFAPSLGWLVFFRILQGVGGGGLQPSEQAILIDTFPVRQRGMGMAVYGIAVVVAPILGPTLGGWITDNFSWRWIFFINLPVGLLSLMLTSQLVEDPPYLIRKKWSEGFRIDFIGLGLIAMGLGGLQFVLDKGEREDWFESNLIVGFSIVATIAVVAAIWWEWRSPDPLVDLHLLKDRNFRVAVILMFALGFVLFASTLLLPLFLQTLMGYPATKAGLALSPGGLVTMAMMPIVGFSVTHFSPRWLIILGLSAVCVAMTMMSHFNLAIDYRTAVVARCVQGFGLAFLFVPINTTAYAFLPRYKNNNASGLINLARNLGGSVGIAVVATLLSRRAQVHQTYLSAHMTPFDLPFQHAWAGLLQGLQGRGLTALQAAAVAPRMLLGQLMRQSMMLAYLDCFRMLAGAFLCVIPLALLIRRPPRGGGPGAMH